jgi:hypothetical protein
MPNLKDPFLTLGQTFSTTSPTKYQFARPHGTSSFNTLLLVPSSTPSSLLAAGGHSSESEGLRDQALYNVAVQMNLFQPFSFTTHIRRGGNEDGAFVGEFEYVFRFFFCVSKASRT